MICCKTHGPLLTYRYTKAARKRRKLFLDASELSQSQAVQQQAAKAPDKAQPLAKILTLAVTTATPLKCSYSAKIKLRSEDIS